MNGRWIPKTPVSLSTRDFEEAKENARDKFSVIEAGSSASVLVQHPIPAVDHSFRIYAEKAIVRLDAKAQAIREQKGAGKDHTSRDLANRISKALMPKWADTPITDLTEEMLNDWVMDTYRVEDRQATFAAYGSQSRDERASIYKRPTASTLGNLDAAFAKVWEQAAAVGVVNRRQRPTIEKETFGEGSKQRAFIDRAGVQTLYRFMSNEWLNDDSNGHSTNYKRLLRAYLATAACTGIRPGLELKRVQIGNVKFKRQEGHDIITIHVAKNQGKYKLEREVVVYEGDVFPIRTLLVELLEWQASTGAKRLDYLFSWPEERGERRSLPHFTAAAREVFTAADILVDEMTGENRVPYSLRHYFATELIERNLTTPQVAQWLGTSDAMVERHYNRYIVSRHAHLVNGSAKVDQLRSAAIRSHNSDPYVVRDAAGSLVISPEDDDPEIILRDIEDAMQQPPLSSSKIVMDNNTENVVPIRRVDGKRSSGS